MDPIVIDPGSFTIKAGFAAYNAPADMIPSVVSCLSYSIFPSLPLLLSWTLLALPPILPPPSRSPSSPSNQPPDGLSNLQKTPLLSGCLSSVVIMERLH